MKIVRYTGQDGKPRYGAYENEKGGEARVIEGDLFTEYRITNRREQIVRILPPIAPPNIFALGFSYGKHAEETDVRYPEHPVVFLKATTSVIGHGDAIVLPNAGPHEVDYEAELAVIIGKTAKNVPADAALDYVFGYTCGNDISARDWQFHKQKEQWARGKSFDTFCPLGPCIVTKDEITAPDNLLIRSILNGEVMQDSNTSDMFYGIANIVSDISQSMTLRPGTVIMTGTPAGVGFTREPPIFLKEGDSITVMIEGIGELTNTVRNED